MFKLKEFYNKSDPGFSLILMTPYEYELDDKHCLFNFKIWKYSWWFKIPQIIKPKEKWIDCSKYEWSKSDGYTDYIQRQYGFSFVSQSGVHVYYGIQPGSWSRDDPENSDHSKVFNYFWNYEHVRHSIYDINGEYLCTGDYFHEWEFKKNSKPYNKETRDVDFQTVAWFTYPKYPNWTRKNYTEQISDDIFSDVQSNTEVYRFFEFKDKTDDSVTIARTHISEREWIRGKWKWLRAILKYVPGCRLVIRSMEIDFRDEVGSRKGSWKGGTIGMGFDMKPGESLSECWERFVKEGKV